MAYKAYMKIDGMTGNSVDAQHAGWIEVDAFRWGVTMTAALATGTTTSRPQFSDFTVTKRLDRASIALMTACASGKRLASVVLQLNRGDASGALFAEYALSDVLVTAYQPIGDETDPGPLETVSFAFTRIVVKYVPTNPDGSAATPLQGGWDLRAATKV